MSIDFDAIKQHAAQDPPGAYARAGLTGELKRAGTVWTALCPFHDDHKPSFNVLQDGYWTCRACHHEGDKPASIIDFVMKLRNCTNAEAAEELGRLLGIQDGAPVTPRPLTKREPKNPKPFEDREVNALVQALLDRPELFAAFLQYRGLTKEMATTARLGLDVNNARITIPVFDGEIVRDIRRWRLPDEIAIAHGLTPDDAPDAKMKGSRIGDGTAKPRLYDRYDVTKLGPGHPLYFTEGEFDALRLLQAGYAAFTVTCGYAKWPNGEALNPPPDLTGRTVYIIGDNDQAGDRHNEVGAANCYQAGAEEVYSVAWPEGTPEKHDVSDWLNAGRTLEELLEGASRVPKPEPPEAERNSIVQPFKVSRMSEIHARIGGVVWDWRDWIPRGFVTLLVGPSGAGKSSLALEIARRLEMGLPMPDGQDPADYGRVLWFDLEQSIQGTIDRAKAWGIDLLAFDETADFLLSEPGGIDRMVATAKHYAARIIIIDALASAHAKDENSAEMRAIMNDLANAASANGLTIIILHHVRKRGQLEGPDPDLDRVRGSSAIVALCRSVIACWAPLKEDADDARTFTRHVQVLKANFARIPPRLAFTIGNAGLDWCEPIEIDRAPTARDGAADWLRNTLRQGKRKRGEILAAGAAEGYSERTIERARKALGVLVIPDYDQERNAPFSWWGLPG